MACVIHAIKGLGRVEKKRSDLPLKFNGVPFNQRRDARAFPLRAKTGQAIPIGGNGAADGGNGAADGGNGGDGSSADGVRGGG